MLLRVTKSPHNLILTKSGAQITLGKLGQRIREGAEITVACTDGFDWTKETLVRIAFENVLPSNTNTDYVAIISEFVSEAQLYLIIGNGGYESYNRRKLRGLLFNADYYIERLEELKTGFLQEGGSLEELNRVLENR
jgi:hypothetical protein